MIRLVTILFTVPPLLATWANADPSSTEVAQYPNGGILLEPAALVDRRDEFVILDTRSTVDYDAGHVPGSISAPHEDWQKNFGAEKDTDFWSEFIGGLGIDGKKSIVVLDDSAGLHAARVWFILKYFGVQDVRLLNGFWRGWREAKLPVSKTKAVPTAVPFVAKRNEAVLATKERILGSIAGDGPKLQIVDARSPEEFLGIKALDNPRVGHLPAACHLDWIELVDTRGTHRFKSPADLDKLLKKAGVDLSKPVVTHCQGGGRAAVMMFAAELMGAKEVSNYYSSFQEWSRDPDAPIEQANPDEKSEEKRLK